MISDRIKPYRAKNLVDTLRKTQRILTEAGLPANAVPTRLLFPIAEACSIEDNETLQDMWAGLLATASQQTDSVSPSFIETLKQLTPDDARHLEVICQESVKTFNKHRSIDKMKDRIFDGLPVISWAFGTAARFDGPEGFEVPISVYADTYQRLGLIRRTFSVDSSLDTRNLQATPTMRIPNNLRVHSEVDDWNEFTEYAVRFLDACHGPLPAKRG